MLIVPVSQKAADKGYKFKATGVSVYTFEEALYHCLHFWKQSVDDFCCEEFVAWVKDELGLSFLSSKIKDIGKGEGFGERLIRFLGLSDYLDGDEVEGLRGELLEWESRLEWEKLKERGDDLMDKGESEKAFALYCKALLYADNVALYNNAAIALMKQGDFAGAAEYLAKALSLEPDNVEVLLHLAEAKVLDGDLEGAGELLDAAQVYGIRPEIHFFRAEIQERDGNVHGSVSLYEQAIAMAPDEAHYIYALAEVYAKLRQYEKATKVMERVRVKDKAYLKKLAELHVKNNNIPAAVRCIEQALVANRSDANLWARLAAYHRQNYDLDKAHSAITAAMAIDQKSARVSLEYARVRKAQGRIKDYQVVLNRVLDGLKNRYRENVNYE